MHLCLKLSAIVCGTRKHVSSSSIFVSCQYLKQTTGIATPKKSTFLPRQFSDNPSGIEKANGGSELLRKRPGVGSGPCPMRSPINARSAVLGSSAKLAVIDATRNVVKKTLLVDINTVDAASTNGDGGSRHPLPCDATQVCARVYARMLVQDAGILESQPDVGWGAINTRICRSTGRVRGR